MQQLNQVVQKVSGTGTKKLNAGQNKLEVVVTASNGTK